MKIGTVKKLVDLAASSTVAEIEISNGSETVRISTAIAEPTLSANTDRYNTQQETPEDTYEIRCKQVGRIDLRGSDGLSPMVEPGLEVRAGDILGHVVAMGLSVPIEADQSGQLVSVLSKCGEPVEYDQPLFVLRHSSN